MNEVIKKAKESFEYIKEDLDYFQPKGLICTNREEQYKQVETALNQAEENEKAMKIIVEKLLKSFNESEIEERVEEPWMIISYPTYKIYKNKHLQELINATKTLLILVNKDNKVIYKVDENGELVIYKPKR